MNSQPLHENCPNKEFFLVRIFLHSDWIRRHTEYISVFNPNVGKYGPEKNSAFGHFSRNERFSRSRNFVIIAYSESFKFLQIFVNIVLSEKELQYFTKAAWPFNDKVISIPQTSLSWIDAYEPLFGDRTQHKKWSFPLRISIVNVTKSATNCRCGHIYRKNPQWKTSFFCAVTVMLLWSYSFLQTTRFYIRGATSTV